METQRTIAVPRSEKGEIDVHIASQAPALTQVTVNTIYVVYSEPPQQQLPQ